MQVVQTEKNHNQVLAKFLCGKKVNTVIKNIVLALKQVLVYIHCF